MTTCAELSAVAEAYYTEVLMRRANVRQQIAELAGREKLRGGLNAAYKEPRLVKDKDNSKSRKKNQLRLMEEHRDELLQELQDHNKNKSRPATERFLATGPMHEQVDYLNARIKMLRQELNLHVAASMEKAGNVYSALMPARKKAIKRIVTARLAKRANMACKSCGSMKACKCPKGGK